MNSILTVFKFTYKSNIRKKVFLFSTVFVMVIILAITNVPNIISFFTKDSGQDENITDVVTKTAVFFIDDDNVLGDDWYQKLAEVTPNIEYTKIFDVNLEEQIKAVAEGNIPPLLTIEATGGYPALTFYIKDFMNSISTESISEGIKSIILSQKLTESGADIEIKALILSDIPVEIQTAGKMDFSGYMLGLFITMLVFFSVYFYGYGVAMSVATEKTSRVMETLVVSAKPRNILIGKTLAMGAVGLTQLLLYVVFGFACFKMFMPAQFSIDGMSLSLSAFTPFTLIFTLVYFLLGYTLYAMLNSVSGATVSKPEDLQSAMMPTVILSMLSFYGAYAAIFVPGSSLKQAVSFIPFSSAFIMPFRLLNETVPVSEIAISVLLLIAAIIVVSVISIRLYSLSVIHYGQRIKLKELYKMK